MDLTYEVVTPQTLLKYVVKAMSYGDEIDLQNAILTSEASISEHFNKTIFNCLKEKPAEIKNYKDFLKKTTVADRAAIVAGLYHVSYGDEYITDTICPMCSTKNTNKIELTKFGKVDFYPGKPLEILEKEWDIELPVSKYKCKLKIPTLDHELFVMQKSDMYKVQPAISNLLLYIRELEDLNGVVLKNEDDTFVDMVAGLKLLFPKDVRKIKQIINDELSKHTLDIKFKVICSNDKCKHQYTRSLDFVEQFLRSVIEA